MKEARHSYAAIEFNGMIYVAEGIGATGTLRTVECFDIQNNE